MFERDGRLFEEQARNHDQVFGHDLGIRLVEGQEVTSNFRIEIRRVDVIGQRRALLPATTVAALAARTVGATAPTRITTAGVALHAGTPLTSGTALPP